MSTPPEIRISYLSSVAPTMVPNEFGRALEHQGDPGDLRGQGAEADATPRDRGVWGGFWVDAALGARHDLR